MSLMARFEIDGVFYFMAAAALLLALVAGFGSLMTPTSNASRSTFRGSLTPQELEPLAHDPLDPLDGSPPLNDPE